MAPVNTETQGQAWVIGAQLMQIQSREVGPLSLAQAGPGLSSPPQALFHLLDGAPLICQFEDGFSVCSTGMKSGGKEI